MKTRNRSFVAGIALVGAGVAVVVAGAPVVAAMAPAVAGTAAAMTATAGAQHQHSPYAHEQSSEVPSLTPEELEQLRNGDGMGLAKPAELNHFPGPKHVLELADELAMTAEQRTRTEAIFAEMQEQARSLGDEVIEAEKHLNTRFAHGHIDETALAGATATIAELYGQLRFTHLRAHLLVTALLTPEQIGEYDRLRGYSG